ncbi:MAG TPA: hypothetical protein DIW31_06375 [Bacteroidales bacterium]|nr:hypothetical protein [Bacteroidales bacterium]
MQNLDEKLIFDKVRSTLEEYQPECSSSDWSKMSVLLDKHSPVVKLSRRNDLFIGFIAGVIVTLSFTGVLYFSQGEKMDNSQQTSANNVAINNIKINEQPIFFTTKSKKLTIKKEKAQFLVASGVADVLNIDISNLPEENDRSINYEDDTENYNSDKTLSNQNLQDNQLYFKKIIPKVFALRIYKKNKHEKIVGLSLKESPVALKSEKKVNKSKFISINWDLFKGSFSFQDDMYKRFIGPDRVRLGYMPELTLGNFQDKAGIGQGVGVELEGPVSKRVFVGVGFNLRKYDWSKEQKFKSLQMNEFPDTSFHYVVDSIHQWKGRWRYFEIPLSLKLQFMGIGKSKIFLNTYLAAVLMQSEYYEYSRIIKTDKFTLKDQPSPFTNIDIFGNVRIGLEYRYFINRRWNFYFEPYYKWYLKGMGNTTIKPRGFGINVGLIYQFNLHE